MSDMQKHSNVADLKLTTIWLVVMLLVMVPFVVFYPDGMARVGMSQGFLIILQNPFHIMLVLLVGIWSSSVDRYGIILIPFMFILLFIIGSFMQIGVDNYHYLHLFMLGAILIFGIIMSISPYRNFIIATMVCGSLAYHLGFYYSGTAVAKSDQLFFLLGELLSLMLLLATSVSLGTFIKGGLEWRKGL